MLDKKINLEEIVDKLSELIYRKDVKQVLKEFAQQILELAAENAETDFDVLPYEEYRYFVDKQSIIDTIKQIE